MRIHIYCVTFCAESVSAMTSFEILASFLKPLEVFGLQYFSLTSVSNFSKWRIFYCGLRITFYLMTTVELWVMMFQQQSDVDIEKNVLSFLLKIFSFLSYLIVTLTGIAEALLKQKSERNFFEIVREFEENFAYNFKRRINFGCFKKLLTRRIVFMVVLPTVVIVSTRISVRLSKHPMSFLFLYFMFVYAIDNAHSQLILYKFCFYVDMITLHLRSVLEIVQDFNTKTPNLKEILALKKLYVLTLEMTREFNNFMANTVQYYIVSTVFWLMISNYRLLEIQFGTLEKSGNLAGELRTGRPEDF